MESPNKAILEVRNVSKDFSGVFALKDVNIQLFTGQVNAVIGENGAGKSTLMKIVSGVYNDYEGQIFLNGDPVTFANPGEATDKGIVIIHQELNLIPDLSVAENIFLGREPLNKLGLIDYATMHKEARVLLDKLHLTVHPTTKVSQLRVGQQQLVEIARALLFDSRIMIMDEPTSALSESEVTLLFKIIEDLKAKGVAIVYISHKLDELFRIADRFTVLRDGRKIGDGSMAGMDHDSLIRMMVGRELVSEKVFIERKQEEEILKVEKLCFRNPQNKDDLLADHISFTLHKGEILGIYGLMGAGRTELLEAIFGLFPKYVTGKIHVQGKKVNIINVADAIDAGIALVPEDRKLQGLILNMNVAKNTSLASLEAVSRFNIINRKKETGLSHRYINRLNTQVASEEMTVDQLSGGNQQKVVIAKWLATHPKILLLDEPTRGIDIGAKAQIYELIRELAAQGMGIVMASSELTEILALSDNIMVLSESKHTATMKGSEATEELIMKAALAEKN